MRRRGRRPAPEPPAQALVHRRAAAGAPAGATVLEWQVAWAGEVRWRKEVGALPDAPLCAGEWREWECRTEAARVLGAAIAADLAAGGARRERVLRG